MDESNLTEFPEVQKNIPIHQYILENAPYNENICLYNTVSKEKLHFHQLPPKIFFLTKHLKTKLSLKPKDRCVIYLKPFFSLGVHVLLFLSIHASGAISTFIDSTLPEEIIQKQLNIVKPKVIITHEDFVSDKLLTEKTEFIITTGDKERILGLNVKILPIKQFLLFSEDMQNIEEIFESSYIATLPFNVKGKCVRLTQGNILSNLVQLGKLNELGEKDTVLLSFPYNHIFSFLIVFWSFTKGSRLITFPKFTFEKFLITVAKLKISKAFIHIEDALILYSKFRKRSDYSVDISCLKSITVLGSNQLSKVIQRELSERMKTKVKQIYGYSETLFLSMQQNQHSRSLRTGGRSNFQYGSAGSLLALTKIRVVDRRTQKKLPMNHVGDILILSAPQIMKGYLDEEEHNSFYTGDVGYFNSRGQLFILDRKQNMIEVDENEFYESELRDLLLSHRDVLDAVIINDHTGIIKGYCMKKVDSNVTTKDIIEFIFRKKLKENEYFKMINQIIFLKKIPRDSVGNVKKSELRHYKNTEEDEMEGEGL